jgi:hypothetical protein
MRYLSLVVLLTCWSVAIGCPYPTLPSKQLLGDSKQVFAGVVVGVNLTSSDLGDALIDGAARENSESLIPVTDGGPAYEVRVHVTKRFRGKAPSSSWLSVKAGCHNEAPQLLEKGLFAISKHGELVAVYAHQTDDVFGYAAALRDVEAFFRVER